MINTTYKEQVSFLIDILPFIGKESCFAIKGGTAINLFIRDLPRLSVDIDLVYLLFDNREEALKNILEALKRIKINLQANIPDIKVTISKDKLICEKNYAEVKVEVNTIMRGHIFSVNLMPFVNEVQEVFGKFAAIQVISLAELYGGKICAALDRQHPRDLFDVYQLFNNEGFSESIKTGFIATLLSHNRPINEILKPNLINQEQNFNNQFAGMTDHSFSYQDYENTRNKLITTIHNSLTEEDKEFIISFKKGSPEWSLSPHEKIKDLPAVQWKLLNINKLTKHDAVKHKQQLNLLVNVLE